MVLQTSLLGLEGGKTSAPEISLTIGHQELWTNFTSCDQALGKGLGVGLGFLWQL